jgi:hypothetical protein
MACSPYIKGIWYIPFQADLPMSKSKYKIYVEARNKKKKLLYEEILQPISFFSVCPLASCASL